MKMNPLTSRWSSRQFFFSGIVDTTLLVGSFLWHLLFFKSFRRVFKRGMPRGMLSESEKNHDQGVGFRQDPGYQSRRLPALAPSRDPGFSWLIRTSPINRTRNNTKTLKNGGRTKKRILKKRGLGRTWVRGPLLRIACTSPLFVFSSTPLMWQINLYFITLIYTIVKKIQSF